MGYAARHVGLVVARSVLGNAKSWVTGCGAWYTMAATDESLGTPLIGLTPGAMSRRKIKHLVDDTVLDSRRKEMRVSSI